jgi:outer membrane immunogenic protein
VLHFGDGIFDRVGYIAARIGSLERSCKNLKRFRIKRSEEIAGEIAMKRFLLRAVGLLALGIAAPAMAADLPVAYSKSPTLIPVVYDWSGLYIGLNGGWGSSHKCWDQNNGLSGTFQASDGCHNATGAIGGAQLGYRFQTGSFVYGFDLQGDWGQLHGSNPSVLQGPPISNRTRIADFGLFTGQLGYAFNTVLLYVKGGGAVVSDRYEGINTVTGATFDTAQAGNRWGGTAGAGLEFSFFPDWSIAVEYDHLFMGKTLVDFHSASTGLFTREDRIRQSADLFTVRVNYRWGGPVIAKY